MTEITALKQNEYSHWNAYVKQHPLGLPYHLTSFSCAISQSYGLQTILLTAKQQENLVGILTLCIFKSITGNKTLISLPYCDVTPALTDNNEITEKLLAHAKELLKDLKCKHWQYRDYSIDKNTVDAENNAKVRMILELPESETQLMAGFKAKLRSQIKKAHKNNLTFAISDVDNRQNLINDFFQVYAENMRDLGSPPHSLAWFKCLVDFYQTDLDIIVVYFDNIAIAAGILLRAGNNCSVPWASSLRKYNRLNANMMLYQQMLFNAINQGCSTFDFGRSTFGEGTFKFKQQWGAKPQPIKWQTFTPDNGSVLDSSKANVNSKMREFLARIWSYLPIKVSNILGRCLRKFINL